MTNTTQFTPASSQASRDAVREAFRQLLRQADRYIIERKFDEAKVQLAEAKKIDPGNPFIVAFEERISLFESKIGVEGLAGAGAPDAGAKVTRSAGGEKAPEKQEASQQEIERRLRQEIEAEYKERYTNELRKAEELAAKLLEEERTRLEQQQQALQEKFEGQVADARELLDAEYQKKLDVEIIKAEQRLEQQHKSQLAFIESEMKKQLTEQYEREVRELEVRTTKDSETLVEKERRAFQERERQMKEQFNKKLLAALRKTETVFRQQSLKQAQMEQETLRQELTAEFQTELARERHLMEEQNSKLKEELEGQFRLEQEKLGMERERQLQDQLESIRKYETEELERKRLELRQELDGEFRQNYESRIAAERDRIHQEANETIEAERKRLQEEYEALLQTQSENIQKIRSELREEMEKNFLKRLGQIAEEYDHKMELLGTKIPESFEERKALYRGRMRVCYVQGDPSVEDAKKLMQLKELLELTFDDHLTVESDVRLDLYVESVERKIVSAELDLQNTEMLENLKQQFHITAEESTRLEPYILSSFQKFALKGRILVVDDDLLLLETLSILLTEYGYQVVLAPDVDTAAEKLDTTSFDLILCDIKFPEGEFDGFRFYKIVQDKPQLHKVPFILMSALKDGVIVRSGVQLGVDDYLTKPMDPDLLIAVIEGKLKRYRAFQHD